MSSTLTPLFFLSKSSLFNALTNSSVPAENYPFCTIDPSEARVQVPDDRFDWLVETYKPDKTTPAHVNMNMQQIQALANV